jgi:hypothetical protein
VEQRGYLLSTDRLVCAFLRTLEYFDSLMFLTTNNVKKIDNAIWSRINFMKEYPPLSPKNRLQLWAFFLGKIKQQVVFNCSSKQIQHLAKKDLNGREVSKYVLIVYSEADMMKIKSVVKTAAILAEQSGKTVDSDLLLKLIDMRNEFKNSVEGAGAADAMKFVFLIYCVF